MATDGLPVESELIFKFGSHSETGVVKSSLKKNWDDKIYSKKQKFLPHKTNTDVKIDLRNPVFAECRGHYSPLSAFQMICGNNLVATGEVKELLE